MYGDPSSVGAPRTAMSASRAPRSVQIADRRNEGIPTNGKSSRPLPPSPRGMGTSWGGVLSDGGRCENERAVGTQFVHVPAREARAPVRYRLLGVDHHASCQENLRRAMADLGHERIEVPQPINLFMDVRVEPDGSLTWGPSPASAGDNVTLRAELDCIVVASACP